MPSAPPAVCHEFHLKPSPDRPTWPDAGERAGAATQLGSASGVSERPNDQRGTRPYHRLHPARRWRPARRRVRRRCGAGGTAATAADRPGGGCAARRPVRPISRGALPHHPDGVRAGTRAGRGPQPHAAPGVGTATGPTAGASCGARLALGSAAPAAIARPVRRPVRWRAATGTAATRPGPRRPRRNTRQATARACFSSAGRVSWAAP